MTCKTFDAASETPRPPDEAASAASSPFLFEPEPIAAGRDNGSFRQFCVYQAPDPETLRSHGKRLGAHRINDIWEIAGRPFAEQMTVDPEEPSASVPGSDLQSPGGGVEAAAATMARRSGRAAATPRHQAARRKADGQ